MIGRTLAHYRIDAAIGAGGMGQVYRATDTKLGRDVALKVLPLDMAGDPDRLARFQREARAVAALNHPNVVTLYSVEESEGVHFLTMELIEGQPLDRLIAGEGLPLDRIVEIASALAEALAAAHEKSILHRDLKPANVMVTNDGRVKVLDFGLAKDVRTKSSSDATLTSAGHTQAGIVMGTPAYMSPEQVAGRALDHRTDIFSLGVLLHEMATGQRPFEGSSPAELISSILRDHPPSVTDLRPELPSDLARVIRRCLEKDPRHRMQTARDVSNEFRDMARTATRSTAVSTVSARTTVAADSSATRADEGFWVAVLPFKYAGKNDDLKALAEGLSEEVVTGLSRFSYLRVIARGSTAKRSSEVGDVRAIGKELGARYVMEGNIRQVGTKLRLAVQLVDATSGAHLWAETYERAFHADALFELQDDLVPRIVSTVADMNGALPRSMSAAVRSGDAERLTPYESVLRSFGYFEGYTPETLAQARSALEAAVKKAPSYGDAWAMLALLNVQDYAHGFDLQADALASGAAAARRAVEVAPSNHLAYFALAQAHFFQRETPSFRNAAERTVALNPMDGNAVALLGELFVHSGDAERGMGLAGRAKRLNPNHPGWYWHADFNHAYRERDYRGAVEAALKCNLPGYFGTQALLAAGYAQLGDAEAASKALRELLRLRPNASTTAPRTAAKWFDAEHLEHLIEGWRKAGLEIADDATKPASTKSAAIAGVTSSGATRAEEGFWVAVLPFKYAGDNRDLKALAEGVTEEVITGLSRFSYLRVIARGSTAKYSSESGDVRAIGKELGARYVMEGSLRHAGSKLRLAVQLVDAVSGGHLWAENYERTFNPENTFALQDDLVPRIVSTVADYYGILPHTISDALRRKPDDQLSPYEAVLRAFSYFERITAEEHARVKQILEQAVRRAPEQSEIWAMLSTIYWHEHALGFNPQPDSLDRALVAARRSVDGAPTNNLGYSALATTLFFQKNILAFRPAAERSIELNGLDGSNLAHIGILIAYSGDWERGCELVESALQLNPNHPGWYWFAHFLNAYRKGDYRGALSLALKFNLPGFYYAHALSAAAYGQLGMREPGQKELQELLAIRPDFAVAVRSEFGKFYDPELVEQLIDGLRKAGLRIAYKEAPSGAATSGAISSASATAAPTSGAARADESFWVAVLPFKYTGDNRDLKALAEGLTEEVTTGLSRFSYLRVIARGSTAKYSSEAGDVRAIGKELGARYVMEGSLRQAGGKLRLAVQLADTVSGANLWAETYERSFTPESVFEVQDDLVPRIVATVADQYGVLPRSMGDALRSKAEGLTPHEAVLRAFSYFSRITAEEHAVVRGILERAVREAPDHADSWAMLSMMYRGEFAQGYNAGPNPLHRALAAAQRAVELAPTHALGHYALATVCFFRKEMTAFRVEAERALTLNPLDASAKAYLGLLIATTGEWDRGCQMVESAMQLNPSCPGYFYTVRCWNSYRLGNYEEVLEELARINMPNYFHFRAMQAAALGQLGRLEEAKKALRDLLALRPDFATAARREYGKWYSPEQAEPIIDGLRKAGLEIPEDSATRI